MWFSLFCFMMFGYVASHPPLYPIYEYRNVKVLSQLAPNEWLLEREDGQTRYRACPDFANDTVIWAGYIADRIKYEDQGRCNSILKAGMGFFWKRYPGTDDVVRVEKETP